MKGLEWIGEGGGRGEEGVDGSRWSLGVEDTSEACRASSLREEMTSAEGLPRVNQHR